MENPERVYEHEGVCPGKLEMKRECWLRPLQRRSKWALVVVGVVVVIVLVLVEWWLIGMSGGGRE